MMNIEVLNSGEIDCVDGALSTWGRISAGMGAASAVAGGLAAIPTPASGGLAGFAVLTGLMSAGAAYLDSY